MKLRVFSVDFTRLSSFARAIFVIQAVLLGAVCPSYASNNGVAEVQFAEGLVETLPNGDSSWRKAGQGTELYAGDRIRTSSQAQAAIRFKDGYVMRMRERTEIAVPDSGVRSNPVIEVKSGGAYFFSRVKHSYPVVKTLHVSASVRGTEFTVDVNPQSSTLSLIAGSLQLAGVEKTVTPGQSVIANLGGVSIVPLVSFARTVQWAVPYPVVVDLKSTLTSAGLSFDDVARALSYESEEERERALVHLNLPAPYYYLADGLGSIYAGDLDKAQESLRSALTDRRTSSEAAAQIAVIRLLNGDRPGAKAILRQYQKAGGSSSLLQARALVAQADYDLPRAESLLLKAVEIDSGNITSWTRLAELALGAGDVDLAEDYLDRSEVTGQPDSYSQVMRGFIALFRHEPGKAEHYFAQALGDRAHVAEATFGLAMTAISRGNLDYGREQLEKAVVMAPTRSLYRSYLAKAYFEQDLAGVSLAELERAVSLDSADPTPWLYAAWAELAEHKPVRALRAIDKAIEKNDNRAIYRSRELLDQDLSAAATGLGRIYGRLGFDELSRIAAMRSVMEDYSNPSAHFLLADSYRGKHLGSGTVSTENVIGRLLIPSNYNSARINPAGDAGLNEYTTLFDRPFSDLSSNVEYNSFIKEVSGSVDYSTASRGIAWQTGISGANRDGFRENDWRREYQLFHRGQGDLTNKFSLAWDAALTSFDQGDTAVDFDPYAEDGDVESNIDSAFLRVGAHFSPTVSSDLLAQMVASLSTNDFTDDNNRERFPYGRFTSGAPVVEDKPLSIASLVREEMSRDRDLYQGDVQYSLNGNLLSLVSGAFVRTEKTKALEDGTLISAGDAQALDFLSGSKFGSSTDLDATSTNLYSYLNFKPLKRLQLTAGVTWTSLDMPANGENAPFIEKNWSKNSVDPKVGIWVEPLDGTVFRSAWGKTLNRTGRGGLDSLEPTFVGGFNQVFDGVAGSEQEFFAVGLDQRLDSGTYIGTSISRRKLRYDATRYFGVIETDLFSRDTVFSDQEETLDGGADIDHAEVYFYHVLSDSFTSTLNYSWEHFEEFSPLPETETWKLQPELRYFSETGLFAFTSGVWRVQDRSSVYSLKEQEDFWIFNFGGGYEFDNRRGAIEFAVENILDKKFHYSPVSDEAEVFPGIGFWTRAGYRF
ncbi:MAG: FecR domain-containing protein [bacterium]|nr:FecR domain-containing protein [bacterium]